MASRKISAPWTRGARDERREPGTQAWVYSWRHKPKCGHEMKTETLEGIEIDRCTFCEGFFLDQGEIEELFLKKGQSQRQSFMRRLLGI